MIILNNYYRLDDKKSAIAYSTVEKGVKNNVMLYRYVFSSSLRIFLKIICLHFALGVLELEEIHLA